MCKCTTSCACNKVYLDGYEVKVGDKMYCIVWGNVEVCSVNSSGIKCESTGPRKTIMYQTDGNFARASSDTRKLYWAKPEIVPPKKKVKKYQWVCKDFYRDRYFITDAHYTDKEAVAAGIQHMRELVQQAQVRVIEPYLPSEKED